MYREMVAPGVTSQNKNWRKNAQKYLGTNKYRQRSPKSLIWGVLRGTQYDIDNKDEDEGEELKENNNVNEEDKEDNKEEDNDQIIRIEIKCSCKDLRIVQLCDFHSILQQ